MKYRKLKTETGAGYERLSLLSWLPAPSCPPTGGRIVVVVIVIVGSIGGLGVSHWGEVDSRWGLVHNSATLRYFTNTKW